MFNWWSFFFQIVNFLVVLYILYKLFFNPLKRIIQTREEMISDRLQKLEEGELRVKKSEEDYLTQMKEIENLRKKELDAARKKALLETDFLMKETDKKIAKAYEKQLRINEQQDEKIEKEIKRKSLEFSLHYSEKLLTELSDEELHQKRINQFLVALPMSDAKEVSLLKEELVGKSCSVVIHTPFNLQENTLQKIKGTIASLLDTKEVLTQSVLEPSLIAGIRLHISNKVLDASIKGELERFQIEMENEL